MTHSTTKALSRGFVVFISIVVALLAWQRAKEKHLLRLAPKGNLGYWIVGEMLGEFMVSPQRFYAERVTKYGNKNFTSHALLSTLVVIGDSEDHDSMLAMEYKGKAVVQWPSHFRKIGGPGSVLTVTGEEHTRLRRLFAPHFTPQAIAGYIDLVDKSVSQWLEIAAAEGNFYSTHASKALTMDVFLETMFGGNASKEEILAMQQDFSVFFDGTSALVPIPLGKFNALGRAMNARKRLVRTMETIVALLKARGEKGSSNLLESLVNAEKNGKGLIHDELINNLITFGLAGFDTSAAVMGSLIALMFSPEGEQHLAKLRKEVKEHVQPGGLSAEEFALGERRNE